MLGRQEDARLPLGVSTDARTFSYGSQGRGFKCTPAQAPNPPRISLHRPESLLPEELPTLPTKRGSLGEACTEGNNEEKLKAGQRGKKN